MIARARGSESPLFIQPDVFAAIAVEDTGDHDRQAIDVRLLADPAGGIKDDRPRDLLGQLPFDRLEQPFASFRVTLARLLLDHLVDLGIAVAVPVQVRTTAVAQIKYG